MLAHMLTVHSNASGCDSSKRLIRFAMLIAVFANLFAASPPHCIILVSECQLPTFDLVRPALDALFIRIERSKSEKSRLLPLSYA